MTDTVYTRPKLTGVMRESPAYTNMGLGITDRLVLLGHADGLDYYDPYLALNLQDVVNQLEADTDSPLLRGLFEAYYSGARDIWVMPVAPMDEYVAEPSARLVAGAGRGSTSWADLDITGLYEKVNRSRNYRGAAPVTAPTESNWDNFNFYERYWHRLEIAYEFLLAQDIPQIVTPIEALFNAGGVDFLDQLANHCSDALASTGAIRIGLLGTRTDVINNTVTEVVTEIMADSRLNVDNDAYKFVAVIVGEASITMTEFPVAYTAPASTSVAGRLANLPMAQSIIYKNLPVIAAPAGPDLTVTQIQQLTEAKLNPIVRTTKGRRGEPFQSVVLTDNTMGATGTDFWTIGQIRLLMHVVDRVRAIGYQYVGSVDFVSFKAKVERLMLDLLSKDHIRGYGVQVTRSPNDPNSVLVDLSVTPYLSVRQLTFTTEVGPGA